MNSRDRFLMEHYNTQEVKPFEEAEEWKKAIDQDTDYLSDIVEFTELGEEALVEGLTDREKTFLFGKIHRMFGECAKRCGRITIFSKANACKDMCIAKKDQAEKAARLKVKSDIAKEKGKTKKAAKYDAKAKQIKSY